MEKAWFYERLFFGVVIVMVKEYSIKDTMSIKISFMHYIKWTSKTNITSSFWGIWRGLYFSATFFIFTIIINWWKVNFSKNLGGLNLAYNKNKLQKTSDYWPRDMLNISFSEKGLGLVSLPYFVYDFSWKMYLMLYSINWPNFII